MPPKKKSQGFPGKDERLGARRRLPLQPRSQATVHRILAATSLLLASMPIELITTNRIARKAGISVGALYRFFPEKQSIIDAIAVRHMEEFRAEFEGRFAELNFQDGPAFLGTVIDAFVSFLDSRPDFRAIAFGPHISTATRKREANPDAVGAGLVKSFMIGTLGMNDLSSLDLRLRVAIETGERLFAFAYEQAEPEERGRIVAELKKLLSGYLFGA
ncbi:MAG TPA: TetR/AcrR family transcriptional regulator [Verrucomicrobiae bacterium]|nr:TetR/AcrR family transcriptional regulator [Verrucomicrobiae bacterium]